MIDDEILDPLAVPEPEDEPEDDEVKPVKKLEGGEDSLDDLIEEELDKDEEDEELDIDEEEESY